MAAAGCDRPPPETNAPGGDPGFTTRDSAGVENHAPQRPAGRFWSIDAEPEIVLGGGAKLDGEAGDSSHLVWRVSGIARLADGRVAVLSAGNQKLFLFEPSGRLSRSIGRGGRGPGEFGRPEHLQYIPPDTLVIWDYWFGPATYFDANGTLLRRRSFDLGKVVERTGANAESLRIPLPDGSVIVQLPVNLDPDFEPPPPGSFFRLPPRDYVKIDSAYGPHSLGWWGDLEFWTTPTDSEIPYLPTLVLDSHVAAGGHPPMIYISEGDKNEIHQFSLDGALVRIIRRATDPVPVTARAHRAWVEHSRRIWDTGGNPLPRDFFDAMPRRESYPPVGGLVVDTEGHLWVREWSVAETGVPDQWSVFSPEGLWMGVLRAPPDPSLAPQRGPHGPLLWVGKDFFLAVTRDELGVERVEGYRIHRGQ